MKMIHTTLPEHPEATLEGYILDCELTLGQEKDRPAIIVCPGGGYIYCSPREAEPVALSYAAKGFHAFILRYSTGRSCAGFQPLKEISWVIRYLRDHAEEWHIAPDKIVTCGFSAGGHLALAGGVAAEHRANAMILNYPVAKFPNMPEMAPMIKLITGKASVSEMDVAWLDMLSQIRKDAPPVFLASTAEDLLTPHGALAIANRYSDLGKPYELHVFQHGPHGYSLANEVTADGSSQVLNPAYAHWQDLSVQWLHKIFGEPQFEDKSTSKIAQHMKDLGIDLSGESKGTDFA